VCKLADSEGGAVEPTGVQRIADRWRGEPVEVIHHIQQDGGLSIGPTAGIVEETDDMGMLLSVTDAQGGSVEHRFFPWATIVQIIAPLG
jgi:hypothetical protein